MPVFFGGCIDRRSGDGATDLLPAAAKELTPARDDRRLAGDESPNREVLVGEVEPCGLRVSLGMRSASVDGFVLTRGRRRWLLGQSRASSRNPPWWPPLCTGDDTGWYRPPRRLPAIGSEPVLFASARRGSTGYTVRFGDAPTDDTIVGAARRLGRPLASKSES